MIDAVLGACLGFTFIAGAYGVWTWQNFSRKMAEYADLESEYDALYDLLLHAHRENVTLRERLKIGDDEGEV